MAWQFENRAVGGNNADLLAERVNTLDVGANVYPHATNVSVIVTEAVLNLGGNVIVFAGVAERTLTPSQTNYVYVSPTGTVEANIVGFPTGMPVYRLATVVAPATGPLLRSDITDARPRVVIPQGRGYRVGVYHSQAEKMGNTTGAPTADTLIAFKWPIKGTIKVDRIAVHVTIGAAVQGRLGIYAPHVTLPNVPGALLLDAGNQDNGDLSATGVESWTVATTLGGDVWVALTVGAGITWVSYSDITLQLELNSTDFKDAGVNSFEGGALTPATAMPATFPAVIPSIIFPPVIGFRAA